MQMNITFDPATELDEVKDIIAKLEGDTPAEPAAKAPAKKAAPARKTAAKKAAPEPEEEPDEEEAEEETTDDAPTLEDCIARAQELVGEKRTQEVKDAVAEIGVERVSKLKTKAQFKKFLELVADGDDGI